MAGAGSAGQARPETGSQARTGHTLRMIHTDGPTRVGATMEELTQIVRPWKSVTRWRVTEFDPPRRQVGSCRWGLREMSQKAEFRCASSDADSLFWCKMHFWFYSG
jgi:hypothetical protein